MRQHRPLLPTLEIFDDGANRVRPRVIGIYAVLITANLLAWAGAFASFHGYPLLLATALIAYGLGLRHAVYADHIAAIDNVTRKMMQEGKRPITAAFFFPRPLDRRDRGVDPDSGRGEHPSAALSRPDRDRGVGTLISVLFLFAIPIINIVVLAGVYRLFGRVRRGENYTEEDLNDFLARRGLFGGLFRTLFRLISRSWHMYPLGFLFGLGFDTATEIGLFGISAAEASKGLSTWSILVFPALVTAGMSLVDT